MTTSSHDIWCQWLLHRRFADDPERMEAAFAYLHPIRDKVLEHAQLGDNEVLLDVGSGDGLITFGALERVPTLHVIVNDISHDLLEHTQAIAQETGLHERCQFLQASAHDLSALADATIDVVTTRSVLIYVAQKQQAFNEFYRVLKPNGRLSIFEPINRFAVPGPDHCFWGYEVTPVQDLAQKVTAIYRQVQPLDSDPMLNFDERDLLVFAERAGFTEIHLELQVEVAPPRENVSWAVFTRVAGNPKIPTLEEAIQQALTEDEAQRFIDHLQPLVEAQQGTHRSAVAYLWASKR
jgi:arsenite methyltransferase